MSRDSADMTYRRVHHHWFLKSDVDGTMVWIPFSMKDSLALEDVFNSPSINSGTVVATNGGRYDVNILWRRRLAVYWNETPQEVRRCSWFSKSLLEKHHVPYEETTATYLEEEYKTAVTNNVWGTHVELPNGEEVVFRGPYNMVHYQGTLMADAWGSPQPPQRPRSVKRGFGEFHIEEGEPDNIDHVLIVVHGIGSAGDLNVRKVARVDEFRALSRELVQSHFSTSFEHGKASRIEVLPVYWHSTLHGDATGIDRQLQKITLRSIPKLRHLINNTLMDILFYTSPVYCQVIIDTVGNELNRIYEKFLERNPNYKGGVSLVGHSLGAVILFDLLCYQKGADTSNDSELTNVPSEPRRLSQRMRYVLGNTGAGQLRITYPQIKFRPDIFFALGSPIALFVTVRGNEMLGEDFSLPTCPAFFNLFHPFDPVAYRVEGLVNPRLTPLRPVLVPHHKGRKRMHLELKEAMSRLGLDLKHRLVDSVRSTWGALYQLAMDQRAGEATLEDVVNKVMDQQLGDRQEADGSSTSIGRTVGDVVLGRLNDGRRIDYVLQEAPLEIFNEYVFAMTSHVVYWRSEDTVLFLLKELYGTLGVACDSGPDDDAALEGATTPKEASLPGGRDGFVKDSLAS